MKILKTVLIALVAVLTLTAAAEATVDMWTPPMLVNSGQRVECKVMNVTTVTRSVRIRIYDYASLEYDSGSFGLFPVDPLALIRNS